MFRFLTIAAFIPVMVLGISNPEVCRSGVPLPTAVTISGCSEAPCDLVVGTTITMEIDFVASGILSAPLATIFAESQGMIGEYQIPSDQARVCNWLANTSCPLDDKENATFVLKMPIFDYYPLTKMVLEVGINYDSGSQMTCFRFAVETKMN